MWGWAGVIITDRARKYISGGGKAAITSSNDAELFAIVNTLDYAFRHWMIDPREVILIQTDNLHAAGIFNYHFRSKHYRHGLVGRSCPTVSPAQKIAVDYCRALLERSTFRSIFVRHVKAHLSFARRQPRHHVHERLDSMAGAAARQALKDRTNVR